MTFGRSWMKRVVVYSKTGCHLCERVLSELEKLRSIENFELATQDITTDTELYERYRNIIPVVSVDGKVRLAGSTLSNPAVLKETLQKAIFSEQHPYSMEEH